MKVAILTFVIALISTFNSVCFSQSLSGIRIGENLANVSRLGRPSVQNQRGIFTLSRWRFEDGNELSITSITSTGRIVYIESDWGERQAGTISDFPGFYYGRTTLIDIRKRFGNNGFTYPDRAAMKIGDAIIMSNSYEVLGRDNVVATFMTRIAGKNIRFSQQDPSIAANFTELVSIALGDPQYLRSIWGSNLTFDIDYNKILWK